MKGEMKVRAARKSSFTCHGGPMHEMNLWLTSPHTLVFTLGGMTGRYEFIKRKLTWVPK